jgi:hypothetical protein
MVKCNDISYEELKEFFPKRKIIKIKEGFFKEAFNENYARFCIDKNNNVRQTVYGLESSCLLVSAIVNANLVDRDALIEYIKSDGKRKKRKTEVETESDEEESESDEEESESNEEGSGSDEEGSGSDEEGSESNEEDTNEETETDGQDKEANEDDEYDDEVEDDEDIEIGENGTLISADLALNWNKPQKAVYDLMDDIFGEEIKNYNIRGINGKEKLPKDVISDIIEYVQQNSNVSSSKIREYIRKKIDLERKNNKRN